MPIKKQDLAKRNKKAKKPSFNIYNSKLTQKTVDTYVQNNAVNMLDSTRWLDDVNNEHAYGKVYDGTITLNFALDTDEYHEIKLEDAPKSLNLDKLNDPDYWYDDPSGIKQSMYFADAYISTEYKSLNFNCYVLYANVPKGTDVIKIETGTRAPSQDDIEPGCVVVVPDYDVYDLGSFLNYREREEGFQATRKNRRRKR